jgi:hypothetical protein
MIRPALVVCLMATNSFGFPAPKPGNQAPREKVVGIWLMVNIDGTRMDPTITYDFTNEGVLIINSPLDPDWSGVYRRYDNMLLYRRFEDGKVGKATFRTIRILTGDKLLLSEGTEQWLFKRK